MAEKGELKKRVLTGLIGIPVVIYLLLLEAHWGVRLLAWVFSSAMVYEFSRFAFTKTKNENAKVACLVAVNSFIHLGYLVTSMTKMGLLTVALVFLCVFFLWEVKKEPSKLEQTFEELMAAIFEIVYFGFLMLLMVDVRSLEDGRRWIVLFFVMVWATDTGAYFGGRAMGEKPLFSIISPKKTVEGAVFGVLSSILVAFCFWLFIDGYYPLSQLTLLAVGVSLFAQVGDLLASFAKRAFSVKDSSHILPGHGGMIDRFDGVVFALPLMYACSQLIF